MERPNCRCCGSARTEYIGEKNGEITPGPFFYYRCAECGFTFVSPFLESDVYNEAYYRGEGPDPFVDYETEYHSYRTTDRMLEFEDLLRVAESSLRTPVVSGQAVHWLDFGCGAGGFLKFLRDRGQFRRAGHGSPLQLSGHDVGVWADRLRDVDRFTILTLEELTALPAGSLDIVSMVEVIEHIPYPQEAIRLAARLLRPGGLLLLTTGNLGSSVARRQGIHYRYCMSEIHISLFTPNCLSFAYRQAGLNPLKVRYRGLVAFKVVKSVRGAWRKALARRLVRVPLALRLIDGAYGVSEMPCAVKPLA